MSIKTGRKLLQMDFPFAGPWGEELTAALRPLAEDIAATPGLVWKIWTENQAAGRAGGIYLFEDEATLEAYRRMHTERLAGFGVSGIEAKVFDVNADLSAVDRAPLAA